MQVRRIAFSLALGAILLSLTGIVFAQTGATAPARTQSDGSPAQRLSIMRSQLDSMRRSLGGALSTLNAQDDGKKDAKKKEAATDDPRQLLRGLDQEANSILNDVNDVRSKQERAERFDVAQLDKLEASVTDLNGRVEAALRATAVARRSDSSGNNTAGAKADGKSTAKESGKKKKGGGFLGIGRIFGGSGDEKYADLTGAAATGRDRELFEAAAKEARKGNQEEGRYLFSTIITTYPDSAYLPASKLAIADTFYLEGSTSSLIQAAAAYQDWLTFFPTHPLADDVMLKAAECEMRQMGLSDRDISHSRKAEQRLKALLQQFPNTSLRQAVELRLRETQENLAMHNLQVARFYIGRNEHGNGGLKGAQSRLNDIVKLYPNFSYLDEVLFRQGSLYLQEEEPDEAAKYFQQLARDYPKSEYAEKAREQLNIIGAPVPEPDPIKAKFEPPPRPSFTEKVFQEVLGTTQATVDKNGVLISKDEKDTDLLAEAVRNGGQLPATTPNAPTERRTPPARVPVQNNAPRVKPAAQQKANPAATPDTTTPAPSGGIKIVPTQPGPPADPGSNTASPTLSPAVTPPAATPSPSKPATTTPSTQTGVKP
ncbi:MAG: outer membrane protein assembly factor BamD [Pyrinomonadaceae bacterium]